MKERKATIATVKSFIKKNRAALLVRVGSRFDPMTDCVQSASGATFAPASDSIHPCENNAGVSGVWFVGRSRDYVQRFQSGAIIGFEVSNSCGHWVVAVAA